MKSEKTKAKDKVRQAEHYIANREKIRANQAAYYEVNAEKINARQVTYRADNPGKIKAANAANAEKNAAQSRMKKYGMSPEAFQLMLLEQRNTCGICKKVFSEPHVDHDHKTGEVRGLLCQNCNNGLGHFRDSLEILELAKEYLLNAKAI